MYATGLPFIEPGWSSPTAQSSTFLKDPGSAPAYSGVENRTASALRICSRRSATGIGRGVRSSSGLKWGSRRHLRRERPRRAAGRAPGGQQQRRVRRAASEAARNHQDPPGFFHPVVQQPPPRIHARDIRALATKIHRRYRRERVRAVHGSSPVCSWLWPKRTHVSWGGYYRHREHSARTHARGDRPRLATVLTSFGITAEEVRLETKAEILGEPPEAPTSLSAGSPPLTTRAKRVFEFSLREALRTR